MLYKYVKYLAVALAGGVCCTALAQANLLTNPGFEDATTAPWMSFDQYNYHSFVLNTASPYAGAKAGHMTTWGPWWSGWNYVGIRQDISLSNPTPPGYSLGAWVKDNSSGQAGINNFIVRVQFRDSATNLISQMQQTFNIPGDGNYHFVGADFISNAPPAAVMVSALLISPVWYSDALVDNVSLIAMPVPLPVITNIIVSGGNVVLCGTNGTAEAYYSMLHATNLALPVANWTVLATRQFDTNGNFSCTNALAPGAQKGFYQITYASAVSLSPTTLPTGTVGSDYGVWWWNATYWEFSPQYITASGGTTPYTFVVTSGNLPPGLTLNTNGLLSGTSTVAGVSSFTVTATDANARTGSRSYSLTVQ